MSTHTEMTPQKSLERIQKPATGASAWEEALLRAPKEGLKITSAEDDEPKARDYGYEVDGVRFVVDKKSFLYLVGSTFDYEKTLMFQGFKFVNPNEASSCGCGHSFTVK